MKRRDFLKGLGIGTAAIVAMPLVLAKEESYPAFDNERLQRRIDFLKRNPDETEKWVHNGWVEDIQFHGIIYYDEYGNQRYVEAKPMNVNSF